MRKNFWRVEQGGMSSTDLAIDYARRMVEAEAKGPGDLENAMHRLETKTGIGYWTLWGLWNRRRKLIDTDLFLRLQGAYYAVCERQLARFRHELAVEQAQRPDDDLEDLERQAAALAEKIRRKKEGRSLTIEHIAAPVDGGA